MWVYGRGGVKNGTYGNKKTGMAVPTAKKTLRKLTRGTVFVFLINA